jgi:hypothetical protein
MIRASAKCEVCHTVFHWPSGKGSLADAVSGAYCAECGGKLRLVKGPGRARAVSKFRPVNLKAAIGIIENRSQDFS